MTRPDLLLEPAAREQVAAFLEPRVEASGNGDASDGAVREALRFLNRDVMGAGVTACGPNGDLVRVAETIATAAWCDMSAAFSLWCHRMVLEYLSSAPPGSPLDASILPDVLGTRLLGSTALAGAMARHVGGSPLSVEWRRQGDAIVLNGRVNWASNLFPPDFVMVTAAANANDGRELIVALAGDTPGVCIEPYPRLLALQATGSSSVLLRDVRLPASWVIAEDFASFITRVRPTFLLLQSSFCLGAGGPRPRRGAGGTLGGAGRRHPRGAQPAGRGGPHPPPGAAAAGLRLPGHGRGRLGGEGQRRERVCDDQSNGAALARGRLPPRTGAN